MNDVYGFEIKKPQMPRWLMMFSGILLLIMGIFMIFNPLKGILSLTIMIGTVFLLKGLSGIIAYFRKAEGMNITGWTLVLSILDIIFGLIFLFNTLSAVITIPWLIGFWFLFNGIIEIIQSFALRSQGGKWWIMLIWGIISVIFALVIMNYPAAALVTFEIAVGVLFAIYGVILIIRFFATGPKKTGASVNQTVPTVNDGIENVTNEPTTETVSETVSETQTTSFTDADETENNN